jgi:AcrR family transcriptional regulator
MTEPSITDQEQQDLRSRIVIAARDLFLDHGYSKVTTSEIAQSIGISKKTLYKEFENKEEILRAVVIPKLRRAALEVDAVLANESVPFLEKLKMIMTTIGHQQKRVSPVLLKDIYIHAPEIWKEIDEHRKRRFKRAEALFHEGSAKGIFRADIRPEIIVRLYTSSVESLMSPTVLGELPCTSQEVFQAIMTILLEGVLKEEQREAFRDTA